jgi:multicomponent Na+:H+ antiporter subunit C
MTTTQFLGLFNYWVVVFLMMLGFYMVIARHNFIKKVIGINIFQIAVILMYITMGKIHGGTAPIFKAEVAQHFAHHGAHEPTSTTEGKDNAEPFVDTTVYSNPLPSVLMLTAIVVGIGTTDVALSLIVRIREDYGTIEEDEALEKDRAQS